MIKYLKKKLKPNINHSENPIVCPRIFNMWEHRSFESYISWRSYEDREIIGSLLLSPDIGDIVQFKLPTGIIAKFKLVDIRRDSESLDLFIGLVEDVGFDYG